MRTSGAAVKSCTFGDGELGKRERALPIFRDSEALQVAVRDHTRARRHTLRRGDVAVDEAHAVGDEGVKVRSADVAVRALRAEVGPAMIVTVDEDDVGLTRSGVRDAVGDQCRDSSERNEEFIHGGSGGATAEG